MAKKDPKEFRGTAERGAVTMDGGFMLLVLVVLGAAIFVFWAPRIGAADDLPLIELIGLTASGLMIAFIVGGLYSLQINEAAVLTLFDNYKGTDRRPGLRWVWPWYKRRKISLRVRNLNSQTLKVNDRGGNPIEIGAVVVWRVADTAQASFDVDNYDTFVHIQVETALREIASHFSYDHAEDHEPTLRGNGEEVSTMLRATLMERVAVAGIAIDEARLSHLAYAPEIASAMLRRQQAEAILAARQKIVSGAVTMVESALQQLSERKVVTLDDASRVSMVSNLLVVLCADREAQPIVNTGASA